MNPLSSLLSAPGHVHVCMHAAARIKLKAMNIGYILQISALVYRNHHKRLTVVPIWQLHDRSPSMRQIAYRPLLAPQYGFVGSPQLYTFVAQTKTHCAMWEKYTRLRGRFGSSTTVCLAAKKISLVSPINNRFDNIT